MSAPTIDRCWVDGRIRPLVDAGVRVDDSAFAEGRGCYTTALVRGGTPRWAARHGRRLARDAARIGIGELAPGVVEAALDELGRCLFAARDGIVRVQASRDKQGAVHVVAVARETGGDRPTWSASRAPFAHEGPVPWAGAKVTNHLLCALARDHAAQRGADESLLFDADGRLIEGARSNLLVVDAAGTLRAPDPARGGVRGVALEVLREHCSEIELGDVTTRDVDTARELIAVNAVRGARAIVTLDGRTVGDGLAGPVARRLDDLLRDAAD